MADEKKGFIERLNDHPFVVAVALFALLWYLFTGSPPIPTIYAAVVDFRLSSVSMMTAHAAISALLGVIALALAFGLATGVAGYRKMALKYKSALDAANSDRAERLIESEGLARQLADERRLAKAAAFDLSAAHDTIKLIKANFAKYQLHQFARWTAKDWGVRVTIRFADYADNDLVTRIQTVLGRDTDWPISIEKPEKDPLRPTDTGFKVVFCSGLQGLFENVAHLFSEGDLLDCRIAHRHGYEGDDKHLIIEVLPEVRRGGTAISATAHVAPPVSSAPDSADAS